MMIPRIDGNDGASSGPSSEEIEARSVISTVSSPTTPGNDYWLDIPTVSTIPSSIASELKALFPASKNVSKGPLIGILITGTFCLVAASGYLAYWYFRRRLWRLSDLNSKIDLCAGDGASVEKGPTFVALRLKDSESQAEDFSRFGSVDPIGGTNSIPEVVEEKLNRYTEPFSPYGRWWKDDARWNDSVTDIPLHRTGSRPVPAGIRVESEISQPEPSIPASHHNYTRNLIHDSALASSSLSSPSPSPSDSISSSRNPFPQFRTSMGVGEEDQLGLSDIARLGTLFVAL